MQLYKDGAQFMGANPKKGSLQSRIFDASKHGKIKSDPRHLYALVYSAQRYKPFLVEIVQKSKLLVTERKASISEPVALLLVHDLLFSKSGRIQSKQHPWKEAVVRNKTRLHAELVKLQVKNHVKSLDELIEDDETPVRWFRANTIKTTRDAVMREFGHLQKVDSIDKIDKGRIYYDDYVTNLFGVSPREKITSSDAYLKGRIIIQDRASCFPAFILNPTPKIDKVIDACAAPGNKTTHLAAILENSPNSIIAFEKDAFRCKTLHKMCDKAGGLGCISIQQGDFTDTNPEDYPEITAMLVDPSCSGSGIFGRAFDEEDKDAYSEKRLDGLSNFQFKIVKHAMMFPNVSKLVYSTCSIYPQENERVAVRLLEDEDLKKRGWVLQTRDSVIPDWPRRGFVEEFKEYPDPEACAGACVRSLPKVDGGIGFFAVAFQKRGAGSKQAADDDSSSDNYNEPDTFSGFD